MNCSDQLSEILSCLLNNYFLLNLAVVSSSQQLLENSVCLQPIFESLLMHNKLFESLMCNWRALVTMRRKIEKFAREIDVATHSYQSLITGYPFTNLSPSKNVCYLYSACSNPTNDVLVMFLSLIIGKSA